ncbi:hypothetical protein ROHU_025542 [Labeo rohita]|uniref:Uncharacterized protein n=1 Tax=Labeo rohita TaxID=84645 RepID=A0A498MEP1_LABRO|nr:hypothetical protein ROHU_025542 [Labeo rohita]
MGSCHSGSMFTTLPDNIRDLAMYPALFIQVVMMSLQKANLVPYCIFVWIQLILPFIDVRENGGRKRGGRFAQYGPQFGGQAESYIE